MTEDAKIKSDSDGFSEMTLAYNAKGETEVDEISQQVKILGSKIFKKAEKVFLGCL
ncbi:MAG: hypothetical protein KI793_34700 [Rivularia sp. (in: Bacteria)]|nr:hypothetical protein [Rivularia sp. MS3]